MTERENKALRLERRDRAVAVLRNLAVLLAAACLLPAPARGGTLDQPPGLLVTDIDSYATPFLQNQNEDGAYLVGPNVQRHLKAEIAMALASQVTGDRSYANSALRDMQWVIANRLESDGGLSWTGPDSPFFFECHQHWFLIASELIRSTTGYVGNIRDLQRRIWHYLLGKNPAEADFYMDNEHRHGPFFAYRSVDRSGVFMSQAPFKGSYEIGAALWSLALHRNSSWLDAPEVDGTNHSSVAEYLDAMASQISGTAEDLGYVEPARSFWIRALLWTGDGWSGWEQHDWKYALHMQEGALLYGILTGETLLEGIARNETENLIAHVREDGSIATIPDSLGSPRYEYGEALSVLGLAAVAFDLSDRELSEQSLLAGRKVARYAVENLLPECDEDGALLLTGLARVYQAQVQDSLEASGTDISQGGWDPAALKVWPNPTRGGLFVQYRLQPNTMGVLRIIDVSGRERARMLLPAATGETQSVEWIGIDEESRSSPVGRYTAVLEAGSKRRTAGFVLMR